ncbi:Tetratricopeptide-like helical domain [Phytophthora cactorum]|nr:Tetratricopeptide-like helical domain [Phytophthora cactorum]
MASASSPAAASLPGLTPTAMAPTGTANETVTGQEDAAGKKTEAMSNAKTREPKLLFAVAKNVVTASNAARSKKQSPVSVKSPVAATGEANGSMRTVFGIIKRAQASKPELLAQDSQLQQQRQPSEENHEQSSNRESKVEQESKHSSASIETEDRTTSDSGDKPGRSFVDDVREILEQLVTQLDSVDPRKLLAVRLGGELRVSAIAERLHTAKFMLNRTFKREVLFAFQEINSYYTSLFMELSMAVARRSGIDPQPERHRRNQWKFPPRPGTKSAWKLISISSDTESPRIFVKLSSSIRHIFVFVQLDRILMLYVRYSQRQCEKAAHLKDTQQSDEFFSLARVRFTQAAGQGHRDAQYELGVFHENGRGGCEYSESEAATWYAKAADQVIPGPSQVSAVFFLLACRFSRISPKLFTSCSERLQRHHKKRSTDFIEWVAFIRSISRPRGLPRRSTAFTFERRTWGHTDAYYALGKLLETSSLLRDQSAALRFYSKAATAATAHRFYTIAANAGDAEALNALGLMYEEGDGCDLNFRKAAECYRAAADLNSPHAHFNLGCLLSNGKGVTRNVDAAQAHFRKAVELGYSLAQQFVQ